MMQQIKVTDVMRDCQAATVSSSLTVRHAAERLMVNDSAVLIAVDDDGRLAGQISESDIVRQLLLSEATTETIEPILTCYVESVFSTATVGSVLHLFRSSCHEALPVLSKDRTVVGILSRHDIVRLLLSEHSTVEAKHNHDAMKPHLGKANPKSTRQSNSAYGSQDATDQA
ncbi:MAG: CBS domain-containing protein [Fuerstiella sp.]